MGSFLKWPYFARENVVVVILSIGSPSLIGFAQKCISCRKSLFCWAPALSCRLAPTDIPWILRSYGNVTRRWSGSSQLQHQPNDRSSGKSSLRSRTNNLQRLARSAKPATSQSDAATSSSRGPSGVPPKPFSSRRRRSRESKEIRRWSTAFVALAKSPKNIEFRDR